MNAVRFQDDARQEFLDAALDMAMARPGYGVRLRAETYDLLSLVSGQPRIGSPIRRTDCRRMILTGFPFSLIYRLDGDVIEVVAFAHHSRKPGYWKDRLS